MATNKNIYIFAAVLAVAVNIFSWHLPFFWDTILTSTITQHFFKYGVSDLIIPAQLDAGHPPFFYMYVTVFYHLFGKSLYAAHLSMLPFTLLGIISFVQLLQHFTFSKRQQVSGIILFFSIPAVLTQYMLVSYDAILLSLYLAVLVAYLKKRKMLLTIALLLIVGISLRGLFCLAALSLTIYFLEKRKGKNWFKWNLYCMPAILVIGTWYFYHYIQTGWFFATNADGWSAQRGLVDGKGWMKNGISVARCFFDMGILVLSLVCFIYLLKNRTINKFLLICLVPAILFVLSFLPFTNPINHRYFLIVYVLMLLPVLHFLGNKNQVFSIVLAVLLLAGHFHIYPVPVSNAWDCTLAHLSYNTCRNDFYFMNNREQLTDRTKTGSVFPMNVSMYQTNMTDDTIRLINIHGKSMDSISFVLYSNVGNDFSDEQIEQVKKWIPVAKFNHGFVNMILYRNPNSK